jgi:hypothetical protein
LIAPIPFKIQQSLPPQAEGFAQFGLLACNMGLLAQLCPFGFGWDLA